MALKYALFENHLTNDPDDYIAVVQNVDSYNLDRILEEMVVPGGITSTQAAAVLDSFIEAQKKILRGGNAVNTGLCSIYPSIAGVFKTADDVYDRNRHRIKLNANLGLSFKNVEDDISVVKVKAKVPFPEIRAFIDSATGRRNETASPGKVAEIRGSNLKFDPTDEKQGVFFISETGEHRANNYIRNKPGTLIFYIPEDIPSGECSLEVRVIIKNSTEIRPGIFNEKLNIPA